MSTQRMTRVKVAVCRGVVVHGKSEPYTGVFAWRGRSWIAAELVGMIKRCPGSISDADLRAEYQTAKAALKRDGFVIVTVEL